jgi:hypothetical protein
MYTQQIYFWISLPLEKEHKEKFTMITSANTDNREKPERFA